MAVYTREDGEGAAIYSPLKYYDLRRSHRNSRYLWQEGTRIRFLFPQRREGQLIHPG